MNTNTSMKFALNTTKTGAAVKGSVMTAMEPALTMATLQAWIMHLGMSKESPMADVLYPVIEALHYGSKEDAYGFVTGINKSFRKDDFKLTAMGLMLVSEQIVRAAITLYTSSFATPLTEEKIDTLVQTFGDDADTMFYVALLNLTATQSIYRMAEESSIDITRQYDRDYFFEKAYDLVDDILSVMDEGGISFEGVLDPVLGSIHRLLAFVMPMLDARYENIPLGHYVSQMVDDVANTLELQVMKTYRSCASSYLIEFLSQEEAVEAIKLLNKLVERHTK